MHLPRFAWVSAAGGLATALLVLRWTAVAVESPPSLKEAFEPFFLVGTALNRSQVTGSGGRRTAEQLATDIELVRWHFNQITAENDMKWQLIHPREGADGYDFAPADAFVNFGMTHGMIPAGHTLVWHSQTPDWVFAGTNPPPASAGPVGVTGSAGFGRTYSGPRASREELLARMREHIHTVVGRYKGRVRAWDVVNEALADGGPEKVLRDSLWLQIIGPDFVAEAFHCAHEADPDAILRYNDYGLENPVKIRKLVSLIQSLREQRVPIHAIGTQAHLNVASAGFDEMDRSLTEIAKLGLPIHITELDINTAQGGQRGTGADITANDAATRGGLVAVADERLAQAYDGVFRSFIKHRDRVEMVTFWGVNDAVSWRARGRPLLFDGDGRPKPAFDAVIRTARGGSPEPR
ncbi:MAG: endo-1,4-beta-xylanase [Verrucomicrobiae bacterium]|nr:endo-1,4-beta-xylanase [Verrucomicrobiae bacterium]